MFRTIEQGGGLSLRISAHQQGRALAESTIDHAQLAFRGLQRVQFGSLRVAILPGEDLFQIRASRRSQQVALMIGEQRTIAHHWNTSCLRR